MKNKISLHLLIPSFLLLLIPSILFSQQITSSVWMTSGNLGTMSNGNQYSWSMGETFTATLPSSTLTFTQGFQQLFNVLGCTDPTAFNYNANANQDDGSCIPMLTCNITAPITTLCAGESVDLSISSAGGAGSSSQLPANLQQGLVAYYPFNGNANDASGNGNNGTVIGATLSADRFGNANGAYSFDGVNDRISNNSTQNLPVGNGPRTISCWFLINGSFNLNSLGNNANGYGSLVEFGMFSNTNRFGILLTSTNSPYCVTNGNDFASTLNISQGGWHHLVLQAQGNLCDFYLDGDLISNGVLAQDISTLQGQLSIGNTIIEPLGQNEAFNGKIDDVFIYNRALSPSEIQQLFTVQAYNWSNGANTSTTTVTPTANTTYSCTVTSGSQTCTASVDINVNPVITSTASASIIQGQSYTFGTQTLTTAGTYTEVFTSAAGCDSTVTLILSVEPLLTCNITAPTTTLCAGESVDLSMNTTGGALGLPANLQQGLVAYYPFNGNANDASGNGNNGTVNGATLTADRFGNVNSAYSFDGQSLVSSSITYGVVGDFTISGWARTTSFQGGTFVQVGVDDGVVGCNGFAIGKGTETSWHDSPGNNLVGLASCVSWYGTPISIGAQGEWIQFAMIRNSSGFDLFLNGNYVYNIPNSSINQPSSSLFIGGNGTNSQVTTGFFGDLDDVVLFNRVLTPSEIQQLYTAQSYAWNNGATTSTATVTPTTSTTYSCTVTQGEQTCTASVDIAVNPVVTNAVSASIIEGQSYTLGTQTLTTAGTYTEVFTSATGCDSTVTLTLAVEPLLTCNITAPATTLCAGESVDLSISTTGGASGLPANLQQGLVAYYPFNGNANDESGNGNNGTVNGATLTADRFGNANSAYSFDGVSNYISFNGANLPNGNSNRTISCFFKKLNNSSPWSHTILAYGSPNTSNAVMLAIGNNNNYAVQGWADDIPVSFATTNSWEHFVFVMENGVGKVYVNGNLITTQNIQNWDTQYLAAIIGCRIDLANSYFYGSIDDCLIYNHALNQSEIQQLYTAQSYNWSNGATTSTNTVTPTTNTTYSCTVTSGSQTCTASIDINVTPQSSWYADADGDGFGNPNATQSACTQPVGFVSNINDCNDNQALAYTGAVDVCDNGIDEDCSGTDSTCIVLGCTDVVACNYNALANTDNASCTYPIQNYLNCDDTCINDSDSDGVCNEIEVAGCTDPTAINFNPLATDDNGSCVPVIMGCIESSACNFNPAANTDDGSCILPQPEICNGLDENCNNLIDEGLTFVNYYNDLDGDGFGAGSPSNLCSNPGAGYSLFSSDCNDNNVSISPGTADICGNAIDEDCSSADLICPTIGTPANPIVSLNIGQYGTGAQNNVTVNLNSGVDDVESAGTGWSKWYQFTAQSNAARIGLRGSTTVADDNRILLYNNTNALGTTWIPLNEENVVSPTNLGTSSDGGNEVLLYDQLTIGSVYYVCVQNINNTPGQVQLSIGFLYGSQPDVGAYTNYTNVYSNSCQNFKAKFRPNGKEYTVHRRASAVEDVNVAPQWSFVIPGVGSTVCQVGRIAPPNFSGSIVPVHASVDVSYQLPNAFGTVETLIAQGTVIGTFYLSSEADVVVRSSDVCPVYKSPISGSVATNRSVCGVSRYRWQWTQQLPTSSLPIDVLGGAGASRILGLSSVAGISTGQQYGVGIGTLHLDGATTTPYGTASCVRTTAVAGMVMQSESAATANNYSPRQAVALYPNPTSTGRFTLMTSSSEVEVQQITITDITGKMVFQSQVVMNGNSVEVEFGDLATGIYMVMVGEERMRLIVD